MYSWDSKPDTKRQPLSTSLLGSSRYMKPTLRPSTVIMSEAMQAPCPSATGLISAAWRRNFLSIRELRLARRSGGPEHALVHCANFARHARVTRHQLIDG